MSRKIVFLIRLTSLVATIAVAASIFVFSSQSAKESKKVSDKIVELVQKNEQLNEVLPEKKWQKSVKIREYAHVLLFMLLGITSCIFAFTYPLHRLIPPAASTLFCALYSISDELHQKFVDGRAWELVDLGNDAIGYMAGVAVISIAYYISHYVSKTRRNIL